MLIEEKNEDELISFIDSAMNEIARIDLPIHVHNCPNCGLSVRYPIIAREREVDDFKLIISSALKVMDEMGITGNLLAKIKTKCLLAAIERKAREGNN